MISITVIIRSQTYSDNRLITRCNIYICHPVSTLFKRCDIYEYLFIRIIISKYSKFISRIRIPIKLLNNLSSTLEVLIVSCFHQDRLILRLNERDSLANYCFEISFVLRNVRCIYCIMQMPRCIEPWRQWTAETINRAFFWESFENSKKSQIKPRNSETFNVLDRLLSSTNKLCQIARSYHKFVSQRRYNHRMKGN